MRSVPKVLRPSCIYQDRNELRIKSYFLQTSLLSFQHTYSSEFSIGQSAFGNLLSMNFQLG